MNNLKKISPEEINENPFRLIGKGWALLAADKPDGSCNMMTVSWGGVGVLSAPRAVAAGVSSQSETPRGIF